MPSKKDAKKKGKKKSDKEERAAATKKKKINKKKDDSSDSDLDLSDDDVQEVSKVEAKVKELNNTKFNLWSKLGDIETLLATTYNKYAESDRVKLFDFTAVSVSIANAKAKILSDGMKLL